MFRRFTSEQRVVFATIPPAVIGYAAVRSFLDFTEPMALGAIGIFSTAPALIFFYMQAARVNSEVSN